MANNRSISDNISVILEKLNSIQAQDQLQMNAHQRQVSNLQIQNFFRRNKPQVIAASSIAFSLMLIGTGIGFAVDAGKVPVYDDTNAVRELRDIFVGVSAILLGASLFITTIMAICRSGRLIPCLSAMPELPIPNTPAKTKISDHFIPDQVEKLIKLSIHLVDAMDINLEHNQKDKFKLFFPAGVSGKSPDETLNNRVFDIKNSTSVQQLISVCTQFQGYLKSQKLSKKDEKSIKSALSDCFKFCASEKMLLEAEKAPLLSINIQH